MGEWSEYFEDFPEENPANYVGGKFDPRGAEALRAAKLKTVAEQEALDDEIARIIEMNRKPKDSKSGG
jgi:hypothetical protein